MEYITRATSNIIRPTCKEKQLLTSPYYLIKFKSVGTKDIRYCICSDTSSYPNRYQKLTIVETSTPVASTNEVKLDTEGTWYYWIYEQASSTNIDPTGLTEVQQGFLTVSHTAAVVPTYSGYATTYPQYNG